MTIFKIERFGFDGLKNMEFALVAPHIITIVDKISMCEGAGQAVECSEKLFARAIFAGRSFLDCGANAAIINLPVYEMDKS
jgi:hypothetical protein